MVEMLKLSVEGRTCEGCSDRVRDGVMSVSGVSTAEVSHETGAAIIHHDGVSRDILTGAVRALGYTVDGEGDDYHWKDGRVGGNPRTTLNGV